MAYELRMTETAEEQLEGIFSDNSKKGLQKQVKKALKNLSENPKHPSLRSHPLKGAEKIFDGLKVWTSYVQNNTPSAHRILWAYENDKIIVLLQVIPHY